MARRPPAVVRRSPSSKGRAAEPPGDPGLRTRGPGPTTLAPMRSDQRLPMLILTLLGVLSLGAAATGLVLAPATGDLTVHNGSGETILAPSFTYYVHSSAAQDETIRVSYTAPDRVTESLFRGSVTGRPVRTVSASGSYARQAALRPLNEVQNVTGFTPSGPSFVATRSASSLVSPAEANQVSGSVRYTATVTGGYLVGLIAQYHYSTPAGAESGTERLRVTSIGGQPVGG
jgi:hypothetical protein